MIGGKADESLCIVVLQIFVKGQNRLGQKTKEERNLLTCSSKRRKHNRLKRKRKICVFQDDCSLHPKRSEGFECGNSGTKILAHVVAT